MINGREPSIAGAERILGYAFFNPELCWKALSTKGALSEYSPGNQVEALYGNYTLKIILLKVKCRDDHLATAEECHDFVKNISSNNNLTVVGRQLGIHHHIKGNQSQKGQVSAKQIAATMEALIGAAKFDGADEETLERIIHNMTLL